MKGSNAFSEGKKDVGLRNGLPLREEESLDNLEMAPQKDNQQFWAPLSASAISGEGPAAGKASRKALGITEITCSGLFAKSTVAHGTGLDGA